MPPRRRTARFPWIGVAVGIVVAVAAGAGWLKTRPAPLPSAMPVPSTAGVAAASAQPAPSLSPFPGKFYPSQGHQGHQPGEAEQVPNFKYSSDPPTSGGHLEQFPAALINDKPLPKYVQVHMIEHGNVLLQYNCTCPDIAGALAQIAAEYDNRLSATAGQLPGPGDMQQALENGQGVLVAPYPQMKSKIALTAWTRLATLGTVDKAKIMSFINLYLGNKDNAQQ